MRRVISLWLPRFTTDRIASSRPGARDSPLAVVLESRGRRLVVAVNAPAAGAGITPGMTVADARAVLPALTTVPADPPRDAAALARLARWCGRYSPWTAVDDSFTPEAPDGAGALWLDVTGASHLFGGEDALCADLIDRLGHTGYDARAAVAGTPGTAWAAARFTPGDDDWTIVPAGAERASVPNELVEETIGALILALDRMNPLG